MGEVWYIQISFFIIFFLVFIKLKENNIMFLEKVQKTIEKYHMIEKGDSIVVGVSGGADSVALFSNTLFTSKRISIKYRSSTYPSWIERRRSR